MTDATHILSAARGMPSPASRAALADTGGGFVFLHSGSGSLRPSQARSISRPSPAPQIGTAARQTGTSGMGEPA